MKIPLILVIAALEASPASAALRYSVIDSFTTRALPCGQASDKLAFALRDVLAKPNPVSELLPLPVVAELGYDLRQLDPERERDRMILGAMAQFLPRDFDEKLRRAAAAKDEDGHEQLEAQLVAQQFMTAFQNVEKNEALRVFLREHVRLSLEALADGGLTKGEFFMVADFLSRFGLYGEELRAIILPVAYAATRLKGGFSEDNDGLKFFHPMHAPETLASIAQLARVYLNATSVITEEDEVAALLRPFIDRANAPVEAIDAAPIAWPVTTVLNRPNRFDLMDLMAMPTPVPVTDAQPGFPVLPKNIARILMDALADALPLSSYAMQTRRETISIVDVETDKKVFVVPVEKPGIGQKIRIAFHPPEMVGTTRIMFLRRALANHGIAVESTPNVDYFDIHPRTYSPAGVARITLQ